jgi:mono/diheme cytochrome c family protein
VNLKTILMSAAAFAALAACTPAAETPVATPPAPADIAAVTPESGPAAENTTDTLSSAPVDAAAPAPAAAGTTTAAAPPAAPAAPAAAAGPTKEELANGSAVYARTCAMCHGPTGAGTVMGVGLTAGHEYAVIKEKIVKGPINSGDKMPPLGAAMSPDDLDDVAKFVEAGLPQ